MGNTINNLRNADKTAQQTLKTKQTNLKKAEDAFKKVETSYLERNKQIDALAHEENSIQREIDNLKSRQELECPDDYSYSDAELDKCSDFSAELSKLESSLLESQDKKNKLITEQSDYEKTYSDANGKVKNAQAEVETAQVAADKAKAALDEAEEAEDTKLYIAKTQQDRKDYIKNPEFFIVADAKDDESIVNAGVVTQGLENNDCTIFAAINNLCTDPKYSKQVRNMVKTEYDEVGMPTKYTVNLPNQKPIELNASNLESYFNALGTSGDNELLALTGAVRVVAQGQQNKGNLNISNSLLPIEQAYEILTGEKPRTDEIDYNQSIGLVAGRFKKGDSFGIKLNDELKERANGNQYYPDYIGQQQIYRNHAYEIVNVDEKKQTITITDSVRHKNITLNIKDLQEYLNKEKHFGAKIYTAGM